MTPKVKTVEFEGSRGETLAARVDLPSGEPVACALVAHCFTCSKDFFAATRISAALAERRIAVLRFDFTGLGESGGDFRDTNFSSNVEDLILAAEYVNGGWGGPEILVGHSLGGAAVLAAANAIPDSRAVATIGAPCDPDHVRRHLREAVPEIEARGEALVEIGGRPFRIRRQFLEDIAGQKMVDAIGKLNRPLLVFHAPGDAVVGIDNARRIFEAARHPKSFVSLDDADHLLTRRRDADYVAAVLAAWSSRYLPSTCEEDDEEASGGGDPTEGEDGGRVVEPARVRVQPSGDGRFTQRVTAGRHRLLADEPRSHGGDDRSPLTEEQRRRLLEIADRCPVHRALHGEIRVETRLEDRGADTDLRGSEGVIATP